MFVSFLVFLVALLVMLAAVVLIYAPFSIEMRVARKSIVFKFGYYMPKVWVSASWLTVEVWRYDGNGTELENAVDVWMWGFWNTNKEMEFEDGDLGIVIDIHCNSHEEEREYCEKMDMCPEEIEFEERKEKAFLRVMKDRKMDEYL